MKKNSAVWFKAVAEAKEVMEWYFASVLVGTDKHDPKQKQKIADTLLAEIIRLPYAVERDHWLKKLADELNVDHTTLTAEMRRLASVKPRHFEGKTPENVAPQKPKEDVWGEESKSHPLAENIFALFLKFPKLFEEHNPHLSREFFPPTPLAGLYESLKNHYNGSIDIKVMPSDLEREHQNSIDILVLKADKDYSDFNPEEAKKEIDILLARIKSEWQNNKRMELTRSLKEAEKNKNTELLQQILKQIMDLEK